jgi:hypothetical protein
VDLVDHGLVVVRVTGVQRLRHGGGSLTRVQHLRKGVRGHRGGRRGSEGAQQGV